MECLPSSCEKSLSKNCASLLNIELLRRTEPIGLLNPPQMRGWGYAGSSPSNHFWPNGCGNEVKVQPSLEPDSFPVSVAVLLLKKWQEVSICPHTPEKRRTLICRWLKQSCALIFFLRKNSKKGSTEIFLSLSLRPETSVLLLFKGQRLVWIRMLILESTCRC